MLSHQAPHALEERHIWNDPPDRAELAALAAALPGGAADLLSRRSTRYREMGLEGATEPRGDELLDLLAREPRLLRRPIVTDGRTVVVGFDRAALARFGAGE